LYTIKDVQHGCVFSYDYHCNTDDVKEYYNSKCLCSAETCNSLYLNLTADRFDVIMDSSHTTLNRFAMLARACEYYAINYALSKWDAYTLASVGFGEKLFTDSPVWLKRYCAQVIQFIKQERTMLPHAASKLGDIISTTEADGVYYLRLQNLAITIDRVVAFLRRHSDHQLPPLRPQTDAETAQTLVFGEFSIFSKFKDFVEHQRSLRKTGLKDTLEYIFMRVVAQQKPLIEAAREILHSTATALRATASAYFPVAAVLEVQPFSLLMILTFFMMLEAILTRTLQDLAATKTFFLLAQYDRVEVDALQLSVEDFETAANLQLLDSSNLLVKERELSPYFVLEQLMFWDHQPQRKSDVLCFQGVVELPCPTNIMRCCMSVNDLNSKELQFIPDVLAGRFIPKKSCRISSLKFAANLCDAFFGCTALDSTIRQLKESNVCIGCTQLCHPVITDSTTGNASSRSKVDGNHQWFQADRIIGERRVPSKRKRGSTVVEYLVRWLGNPSPHPDSWEPKKNLSRELFAQWSNELRQPHTDAVENGGSCNSVESRYISAEETRVEDVQDCCCECRLAGGTLLVRWAFHFFPFFLFSFALIKLTFFL
jgi:hypothetical protein